MMLDRRSLILAGLSLTVLPAMAATPVIATDVLGRSIAQRLTQALGTQVIVDNKPGATGTIGAAFVARAAPDGTTLLGTSIGPQAIAPHLMDKLPYDPIAGFEPVVIIGSVSVLAMTPLTRCRAQKPRLIRSFLRAVIILRRWPVRPARWRSSPAASWA